MKEKVILESTYKSLKDKFKSAIRYRDFRHNAMKKFVARFVWKNVDDYTPPISKSAWIEKILLKNGVIGFGKVDGEYTFVRGSLGGDLDKRFGTPTKFIWYTNAGSSGEWTIGKDCTVCFNDCSAYPSMLTIDRMCQMLADTDLSIECLIKYARKLPIPLANTQGEKEELEKTLDEVDAGKTKIVKSMTLDNNKKLELTDPEQIKNMECLSRLHDELTRRLCLEFGIDIESKDKKAQIQTAELEAFSTYTLFSVVPDYLERKEFCERTKELFGVDIDVKMASMFDDLTNGKNEECDTEEPQEEIEQEEDIDEVEDDNKEETDNGNE